jgi:hypothetical protein
VPPRTRPAASVAVASKVAFIEHLPFAVQLAPARGTCGSNARRRMSST